MAPKKKIGSQQPGIAAFFVSPGASKKARLSEDGCSSLKTPLPKSSTKGSTPTGVSDILSSTPNSAEKSDGGVEKQRVQVSRPNDLEGEPHSVAETVSSEPQKLAEPVVAEEREEPARAEVCGTENETKPSSEVACIIIDDEASLQEQGAVKSTTVGESFVGTKLSRFFDGHGWFIGTVTSFNPEADEGSDTWTVSYDDGDAEDLDLASMEAAIQTLAEKEATKTPPVADAWCPEGWSTETQVVDDGKAKTIWKHPDGSIYKALSWAKKRAASDESGEPKGQRKAQKKESSADALTESKAQSTATAESKPSPSKAKKTSANPTAKKSSPKKQAGPDFEKMAPEHVEKFKSYAQLLETVVRDATVDEDKRADHNLDISAAILGLVEKVGEKEASLEALMEGTEEGQIPALLLPLIARLVQGSSLPLEGVILRVSDFLQGLDGVAKEVRPEGVEERLLETLRSLAAGSLSLLDKQIPLLAERKYYGVAPKKSSLTNTDTSKEAMWHWEVISKEHFEPAANAQIVSVRSDRRHVGRHAKVLRRVMDAIAKLPYDQKRVDDEEHKWRKIQQEEEVKRQKQAQKEAKEAERRRQQQLKQEERAKEAALKAEKEAVRRAEREERERAQAAADAEKQAAVEREQRKKEAQRQQFKGFFKPVAAPQADKPQSPVRQASVSPSGVCPSSAIVDETEFDKSLKQPMTIQEIMNQRRKSMSTEPRKRSNRPRWVQKTVSVCNTEGQAFGQPVYSELKDLTFKNKMKLFQFHTDERPPYWGTWSKRSKVVNGRRPFDMDRSMLDYDHDSEAEWEEEEPGESLSDSDQEEEANDDGLDYADGWLRHDDDLGSREGFGDDDDSTPAVAPGGDFTVAGEARVVGPFVQGGPSTPFYDQMRPFTAQTLNASRSLFPGSDSAIVNVYDELKKALATEVAQDIVEEPAKEQKKKDLDESDLKQLAKFISVTEVRVIDKIVDAFVEQSTEPLTKKSVKEAIQNIAFRAKGKWHVKPEMAPKFGVPVVDIPVPKKIVPKLVTEPKPPVQAQQTTPLASQVSPVKAEQSAAPSVLSQNPPLAPSL